jgi:hypothetical protein
MKQAAKNKAEKAQKPESEAMRAMKHDINNQLSNILLALEQLKYEITEPTEDCIFYLNAISISSAKITTLLNQAV